MKFVTEIDHKTALFNVSSVEDRLRQFFISRGNPSCKIFYGPEKKNRDTGYRTNVTEALPICRANISAVFRLIFGILHGLLNFLYITL
jgi:hypothetical protein